MSRAERRARREAMEAELDGRIGDAYAEALMKDIDDKTLTADDRHQAGVRAVDAEVSAILKETPPQQVAHVRTATRLAASRILASLTKIGAFATK